ncbi:protein of unknown function [Chryseobacterium sp. JV274]|nr:protein of unknown function [Chryseobacterium sp. JV274]
MTNQYGRHNSIIKKQKLKHEKCNLILCYFICIKCLFTRKAQLS